jgi:hypothetical protein
MTNPGSIQKVLDLLSRGAAAGEGTVDQFLHFFPERFRSRRFRKSSPPVMFSVPIMAPSVPPTDIRRQRLGVVLSLESPLQTEAVTCYDGCLTSKTTYRITMIIWKSGRQALLSAAEYSTLEVDSPPAFNGDLDVWCPEDLLIGGLKLSDKEGQIHCAFGATDSHVTAALVRQRPLCSGLRCVPNA